jgi:hypothetical protein
VFYGGGDSLVIHSDAENRVCFMATPGERGSLKTIMANARLIAAAPDLLAALEALVPADMLEHPHDFGPDWHTARRAIARAKGEA